MNIKILYEDNNILAINKPSGLAVHADLHSKAKTVADWVLKNYPKMKNVGENEVYENKNVKTEIKKPGIVHRLDRDTSGVMLLAKNQKTYEFLKEQFQNRTIKKTYVAIVNGSVSADRGVINKPIGRSPKDFRRYLAGRGVRGEMREAITEYRVVKRFKAQCAQNFSRFTRDGKKSELLHFSSDSQSEIADVSLRTSDRGRLDKNLDRTAPFTYLEVKPKTGRTHQIRVHMKFLNHPVVCDPLYNPLGFCPIGISRMGLHAKSIEFNLPAQAGNLKGETVKIEAPIPLEFKKMIE